MLSAKQNQDILDTYKARVDHFEQATAIRCKLEGWTYGHLQGYAYAGFDTWRIVSDCGLVSINVLSHLAEQRVGNGGLPTFYYE